MTAQDPHTFSGANGTLTIHLGWKGLWRTLSFVGGPYDKYPGRAHAYGVCVRSEQTNGREIDAHLPIRDFSVPTDDKAVRSTLIKALSAAADGRVVYVGCMGGWGRTGLFLALVAKAAGIEDPITHVRAEYTPHAVETVPQVDYVNRLDVKEVTSAMYRHIWRSVPLIGRLF